ncbi:hypothetical protein [Lichenifustis flavocetrariae]|uniref:Uncharacterized protein n=1 Tax=Lichenifustis flavocetrariae TaxID=2949735 RepID=A0AA42CM86_9HYPH|nr:hypothetical protein [Lichenifustis flavocetrariae]MCW6512424.1 hypothetical protein [Lichenifustis flavocetrariae]
MNDNLGPDTFSHQKPSQVDRSQFMADIDLRETAVRAVTKPESLTMGEIQEVAWAFLLRLKRER